MNREPSRKELRTMKAIQPKVGRVVFDCGYVVDMNNSSAVEEAIRCLIDDIKNQNWDVGFEEDHILVIEDKRSTPEDLTDYLRDIPSDRN
jgi:NADPH-dependent ferric siderophore reductase